MKTHIIIGETQLSGEKTADWENGEKLPVIGSNPSVGSSAFSECSVHSPPAGGSALKLAVRGGRNLSDLEKVPVWRWAAFLIPRASASFARQKFAGIHFARHGNCLCL
jgi:hypothetical protein